VRGCAPALQQSVTLQSASIYIFGPQPNKHARTQHTRYNTRPLYVRTLLLYGCAMMLQLRTANATHSSGARCSVELNTSRVRSKIAGSWASRRGSLAASMHARCGVQKRNSERSKTFAEHAGQQGHEQAGSS